MGSVNPDSNLNNFMERSNSMVIAIGLLIKELVVRLCAIIAYVVVVIAIPIFVGTICTVSAVLGFILGSGFLIYYFSCGWYTGWMRYDVRKAKK